MANRSNQQKNKNQQLLAEYAITKAIDIRNELLIANRSLAWKSAQRHARFSPSALTVEDLFQEGMTGLMEAISRFDDKKGFALSTYSTWWIERNIRRAKADRGEMIRYPENFSSLLGKVKRAQAEYFTRQYDCSPKEFVMLKLGISEQEYDNCLRIDAHCGQVGSIDDLRSQNEDRREWADELSYANQEHLLTHHREYRDAAELCCEADRNYWIGKALTHLPEGNRMAVELYFGFAGEPNCSLAEIARRMSMSKNRVQKLLKTGLEKMRELFAEWNIRFEDVA